MFPELGLEGFESEVLRWFGGLECFFSICCLRRCVRCSRGSGGGGWNAAGAGVGGDVRPTGGICDLEAFVVGGGVFVFLFGFLVVFLGFWGWVLVRGWCWLGHCGGGVNFYGGI